MLKKILIHTRRTMKLIALLGIIGVIIASIVIFLYQTTYRVTINGEEVGYTENKGELQNKFNYK